MSLGLEPSHTESTYTDEHCQAVQRRRVPHVLRTVHMLQHILQKRAYLEVVSEELVIELRDLELIGLFPVHDPSAALALWVNQNRIPGSSGHHDAILYTQVIGR